MLYSKAIASLLFLTTVNILSAEVLATPDDIAEIPTVLKTELARHIEEISDLLTMFITVINHSNKAQGRVLGLPEINTTVASDLYSANLEELFDLFETASQSFRTRFLNYFKTAEILYSNITSTISTVVELNKVEENLTKYSYELENVDIVDPDPNSETENEYISASTDSDTSDSDLSSENILAFILSNSEKSDSEVETDYSSSTEAPGADDMISSSGEFPSEFLPTEKTLEMDTDYSTSEISDASDSSTDKTTIAFILSNEEEQSQETEESSQSVDETSNKDVTVTLVPITEENIEQFTDKTAYKSFLDENFDTTTKLFVTETNFDPENEANSNGKTRFMPTDDKIFNGETTIMYESANENKEAEMEAETPSSTDDSTEVIVTPLTTADVLSENYSFVPILTTDYDSFGETMGIFSTTEDDSGEESMDIRSTTEIDNSDEETMGVFSTAEDDDPDGEKDNLSIKELTKLVKILRESIEKYYTENSEELKLKETSGSELHDSETLYESELPPNSNEHMLNAPDLSMEHLLDSNTSENGKKVLETPILLKSPYSELNSEDTQNRENISSRIGMNAPEIYSQLDYDIGVPGEDYPDYINIIATSFTCDGKESPGLYADLETRCQVFHACWPLRRESYLCPVGSTFNQRVLSCDYWFSSTCSLSENYYDANHRLRDYRMQDENELYQYFDESDIYPYNFRADHSHPIFNEMKFLPFLYKITHYATKRRGIQSGEEIEYNKTVEIEFDKDPTLPTFEDLTQETTSDLIDSVKDRFRELLKSFVASEVPKNEGSSDEDPSLHKMKLQEQKYVYERLSRSKRDRSGISPDEKIQENFEEDTTSPESEKNNVLHKSKQSKADKEQIAPTIAFKVLETDENVVNTGILPMTRNMLAANYIKQYKRKKL